MKKLLFLLTLAACGGSKSKATHTVCIEPLDDTYKVMYTFDKNESYCAIYENDEAAAIGYGDNDSCVVVVSDFAINAFNDKTFLVTTVDPVSITEWTFDACEKVSGSLDSVIE
jgi:hypothetical protein